MRNINDEERKSLTEIQGTFTISKWDRIYRRIFAIGCCIGWMYIFLLALFKNGPPHFPFNADQWTLIVLTPLTIGIAVIGYVTSYVAFIFNGNTIVRQYGKRVRQEISIQDITLLGLDDSQRVVRLQTPTQIMSIPIDPYFKAALRTVNVPQDSERELTKRDRAKSLRHVFFSSWLQYTVIGIIFGIAIALLSLLWPSVSRWRLWMLAVWIILVLSVIGFIGGVSRVVVIAYQTRPDKRGL